MKWPKSWEKVEMGVRLSTVRQNFYPIPNRTSGSASGTMPLPTGIMPHSADFTAPTDGNLHLPLDLFKNNRLLDLLAPQWFSHCLGAQ